jgi:hypothetical protein
MRRVTLCVGLVAVAALAWPGWLSGADQKSPTSGSAPPREPAKERLTAVGQLLGEIMKVSDDGKSLTLRMHQTVPQIKFNNMYSPGGGCAH